VALALAKEVGIPAHRVVAEATPADKLATLRALRGVIEAGWMVLPEDSAQPGAAHGRVAELRQGDRRLGNRPGEVPLHLRPALGAWYCALMTAQTLRELLPFIHRHGTFNLLLSNGEALFAHASTHLHLLQRAHPFKPAQLLDADLRVDFAQHTSPTDRVALVATQPLTLNEPWQALPPGELAVLQGGTRIA
jgi:hypothetical protein